MIHRIDTWMDGNGRRVHEMVPAEGQTAPDDFKPYAMELVIFAEHPQHGRHPVHSELCPLNAQTLEEAFAVHDETGKQELPKMLNRFQAKQAKPKIEVPGGFIGNNGHAEVNRMKFPTP